MNTTNFFCSQCGKPVKPGSKFCEFCGAPQPSRPVTQGPLQQTPYPAQPVPVASVVSQPAKKSGIKGWLIAVIGIVAVCLCVSGVIGIAYFVPLSNSLRLLAFGKPTSTPVVVVPPAVNVPTEQTTNTPTVQPPVADTPTSSLAKASTPTNLLPTPPANTATPAGPAASGSADSFFDDFSNPKSGWDVTDNEKYTLAYTSDSFYSVDLKVPNIYVVAIPPYHFQKPVQGVNIDFFGKLFASDSSQIGAVCDYTDDNNYYWAGIRNDEFAVGKVVNGISTALTQPKWKKLISPSMDDQGFSEINLQCKDGTIVFLVGGSGQVHLVDNDLTSGDAGIYVQSTNTKDGPFYTSASIKNFKVGLIK